MLRYGLLPVDYALSTGLRKNLMQVTRLLQNASNHQPFKGASQEGIFCFVLFFFLCRRREHGS
jgi:hypothetical protein